MKKIMWGLCSLLLCLMLCAGAMAEALTIESLREMFALSIDTVGKTPEELSAIGLQYETGDGVVQWYAMAKAYYEAANDTEALQRLEEVKQDMLANSPDGQGAVFDFFRTGVTASQQGNYEMAYAVNYDDAFFFEDPLLRGIGGLGDLLRDGSGVEKDMEKAVAIYHFNAEVLGKGNGYTSLGLLYQAKTGTWDGIEQNLDLAMDYFLLSFGGEGLAETDFKGPRYAADMLDAGYTHQDGTEQAPDFVKAEANYLIAAAGNGRTYDGTACYKLGTYYEEGREGVAQDYEKAANYYTLAISGKNVHATMLGIPQTYLSLGRLYEGGLGVEQNAETAVQYYTQACDAAQENLDLVNAAGNVGAQAVLDEANEALSRLTK